MKKANRETLLQICVTDFEYNMRVIIDEMPIYPSNKVSTCTLIRHKCVYPRAFFFLSYWSFQRIIAQNSYKIFSLATFKTKNSATGLAKRALEPKFSTSAAASASQAAIL